AGLSTATMTSVLRRTRSAARSGNRSAFPLEGFHSMTRFCPSTYPNSRNCWRKGAQRERRLGTLAGESTYPPDLCALLRLARARSSQDAPTDDGDERSPVHHWMTSSARPSTDCGIVRPSAFAVFRLITNSNLVGCSMGRSAGLAPRRILAT